MEVPMKFLLLLVGLVAFLMLLAMPCAMEGPCQTDNSCSITTAMTAWPDAMIERTPVPVLGGAGKLPDAMLMFRPYYSDPNLAAPPFIRRL
jgi:hypothetical protein